MQVADAEAEQPTPFVDDHRPSKLAWVVLGVLGIAALAIPFLSDPALFTDDFSGPEALRAWPEGGAAYAYGDGVYELTAVGQRGPSALNDLSRTVSGMRVQVDARVTQGTGVIGIDCISDYEQTSNGASLRQTAGYAFAIDPTEGSYVIFDLDGVVGEGRLTGDVADGITVDCVSDGTDTTLGVTAGAGEPVQVIDQGGHDTFRAFGLAAYAQKGSATVAFDEVTVTEASSEETA